METHSVTQLQITNVLNEWKTIVTSKTKGMKEALDRLKKLREQGLFIEYAIVYAQLVEHYVKLILEGYASRQRIWHILDIRDPYAVSLHKIDDDTLGDLIGKLKKLNNDTQLTDQLSRLNTLRKELVHQLFNGRNNIEEADIRASIYINNDCPALMEDLYALATSINQEIGKIADLAKNSTPDGTRTRKSAPQQKT